MPDEVIEKTIKVRPFNVKNVRNVLIEGDGKKVVIGPALILFSCGKARVTMGPAAEIFCGNESAHIGPKVRVVIEAVNQDTPGEYMKEISFFLLRYENAAR